MSQQAKPITEVVFRKFNDDKSIIALFPYDVWNKQDFTCSSYQHIGQHSGADYLGVIERSKAATEAEYKELYNELTKQIGYNLRVIKKRNYDKVAASRNFTGY